MNDNELKKCVAAFEATHALAKKPNVYLNTKSDQYTEGFKLLPTMTAEWRRFRREWEARLAGGVAIGVKNNRMVALPPNLDEEAIEKAYWEFDELRTRQRPGFGPMPERDAFKYVARKLIRDHLK